MVPIRRPPATPVAYPSRQRSCHGPPGVREGYNETYIINSELWSMIRDHKEMRAKYRFKSQQPAPMDESARPRGVVVRWCR